MSQPPPPPDLAYQSVSPYRTAPTHVKLAGIFLLISAGLSTLGAIYTGSMAVFLPILLHSPRRAGSPPPLPPWIFPVMYGTLAFAALAVAVVKIVGGLKLLRGGRNAWPWALAAGITGCIEFFWCSLACVLPLAASVYVFIVLSWPHTRAYLLGREPSPESAR